MSRFEDLETFVAVARAGSVSRAADQLRLAKSAVSKRLSDLEARLGVGLITRTTRQLSLTDAGAAFLTKAETILDDLNEAEALIRETGSTLHGRLRIAAPLSFGLSHLKPVIASFILRHPPLNVEVDFSDRQVNLVEDRIDVAVRIGTLADSSLIARKIAPIPHVVAAAPSFWERYGKPSHPDDLNGLDCLHYLNLARPDHLPWRGPGTTKGIALPKIRMLASNGDFVAALAAEGCGFIVEPEFIVEEMLQDGRLERVLTEFSWSDMNLYVVFPPHRRISAKARAFADAVSNAFYNNIP